MEPQDPIAWTIPCFNRKRRALDPHRKQTVHPLGVTNVCDDPVERQPKAPASLHGDGRSRPVSLVELVALQLTPRVDDPVYTVDHPLDEPPLA